MNWKNIVTIYLKELKDSIRDRRTLISTIVIPTVAMPLLFFIAIGLARKVEQKNRAQSSTVMVLGGEPVGPRLIWWNFVASSQAKIDAAKADWLAGRMALPRDDDEEFIPLPETPSTPYHLASRSFRKV